jgi:hypothetical protein
MTRARLSIPMVERPESLGYLNPNRESPFVPA